MSGGEGIRTREEGSVAKRSAADAGGGPNEREDEGKARAIPKPLQKNHRRGGFFNERRGGDKKPRRGFGREAKRTSVAT